MKHLLVFLIFSQCFSQDAILIAFGPKTSEYLKDYLKLYQSIDLSKISNISQYIPLSSPNLIFDISLDPNYFIQLDSLSGYFGAPYITFTRTLKILPSKTRFYAFSSIENESFKIIQMIEYLMWDNFAVFLKNSVENIQKFMMIREIFSNSQVESIIYDSGINEKALDLLIKRYYVTSGINQILVLDEGPSLELFTKLLKTHKINKYGKFYLFGPLNTYSVDLEGSLFLSYEDEINYESENSFLSSKVLHYISRFSFLSQDEIIRACPNSECSQKLIITNQRNGTKVKVGEISDSVKIENEIIFPGNNTKIKPGKIKTKLTLMIANGTNELIPSPNNVIVSNFYKGALYASEEVNQNLKNFEYEFIPTDCGNFYFDVNLSVACLAKHVRNTGLAYISGYWYTSALASLLSFKAFNIFLPQISPFGLSDYVNNQTLFPEFIKMSGRLDEFLQNSIFTFKIFGWKDILIISNDDRTSRYLNSQVKLFVSKMGLNILNQGANEFFPINYTRDDFEKYKSIFHFIKDSKCRILILLSVNSGPILEGFYDIGFRKGDLIIIGNINLFFNLHEEIEKEYINKRKEIFEGSLLFNSIEYEGEKGKKLENELRSKYKNVNNMCLTYDAFYVVSNSIDFLLSKGENYEDTHLLMNAMRTQKFLGCSGNVFFINGENSRNRAWLSTVQYLTNSSTREYYLKDLLSQNIYSAIAVVKHSEPIWSTGESIVPSNYRIDLKCIKEENRIKSIMGMIVANIISLIFLIFSK